MMDVTRTGHDRDELVLVVEENRTCVSSCPGLSQGAGYRVHSVADGDSALREASESPPDVVVQDRPRSIVTVRAAWATC
jgi:CheY-like chemotaxis protein